MDRAALLVLGLIAAVLLPACPASKTSRTIPRVESSKAQGADDAAAFMEQTERELLDLWIALERLEWVRMTYITHDTGLMAAQANEALMGFVGRKAAEATRFDKLPLPGDLRRKFDRLKSFLSMPAPRDPAGRAELARIATEMDAMYAKGQYCPKAQAGRCLDLGQMTTIMAKSRDYDELLDTWTGWRSIAPPMKPLYERFAALANRGAQDLGFADLGQLWNSRYDMPPAEFEAETERLWKQVEPLYRDLHCHVRAKLSERYGPERVPLDKPIPAHLLGNMWAQEWGNIYPLVAPDAGQAPDLEQIFEQKKVDEVAMVRMAEGFFTSLGLMSLPETFYQRSMFVQPRDRDVVCHASAWDIDQDRDVRIKMCIKRNGEDFTTIHHELGHIYFYLVYRQQPPLFRNSAHDGFHEAMGDLMALSVTPGYLKRIGLLDALPPDSLNPLMARALDKVAFLPWGLLVDRWRWGVFSGEIKPADYNRGWWRLREQVQGVAAPVARAAGDFDPGAKYHIPGNTPYTRYFLAAILQFQFHRALCRAAGHQGPLHTCSLFDDKAQGEKIERMMAMGASKPWPEAMRAMIGEERMDASAILEYFAPLHEWLKKQNEGRQCGW